MRLPFTPHERRKHLARSALPEYCVLSPDEPSIVVCPPFTPSATVLVGSVVLGIRVVPVVVPVTLVTTDEETVVIGGVPLAPQGEIMGTRWRDITQRTS